MKLKQKNDQEVLGLINGIEIVMRRWERKWNREVMKLYYCSKDLILIS